MCVAGNLEIKGEKIGPRAGSNVFLCFSKSDPDLGWQGEQRVSSWTSDIK
jgi:hypothetical protein